MSTTHEGVAEDKQVAGPAETGAEPGAERGASPRRAAVRLMQARGGNRAASRMIRVQTKLTVGAAGDRYEREADDVAQRVVQALDGIRNAPETGRTKDSEQNEQADSVASRAPAAQRVTRLQRRAEVGAEGGAVDDHTAAQIEGARGGGAPLDAGVRGNMESAFGSDFSSVRVHTGSQSADLNDRLQAKAFTVGSDIFFRGSMPDPSARSGQELLAHELTHVVQQGGAPAGAQRVQRLKNPFAGLFGKKKPEVGEATDVKKTTGTGLVEMVRAADMKTRIFMSTNKGFLAKVESELDADQKKEVLGLLEGAVKEKAENEAKKKAEQDLKAQTQKEAKEKQEAEEKAKAKADKEAKEKAAQEAEALRVAEVDKKLKTSTEIKGLGLASLISYVETTPTWEQRSTITPTEKVDFAAVLAFAREPGVAAALETTTVATLLAETGGSLGGTLSDVLGDLRTYVACVSANEPISLSIEPDLSKARGKGNALKVLMAGFPVFVLRTALDQNGLEWLIKKGWVADVVNYYKTSIPQPVFQANNGADFYAYLNFRIVDGGDPATYSSGPLAGYIRNFHRFQKGALEGLKANLATGNVGKKPFTLVLHTAIDHNGAFHRDPKMTAVISDPHIFTLLIEGGESLADYQSQIGPLATRFGVGGKLDQVMFAGHGNSRVIEMAGSVKDDGKGKLQETGEAIDLDNDKAAADALFDEVLANMNDENAVKLLDPAATSFRRILFNACLTNSNTVDMLLDGDNTKAKAQIIDYLDKNSSLASYLGKKAKAQGYDVSSLGANASIGQVDLIDSSGGLDLVSTVDPFVTAGKLEYAEKGTEPAGVIRAALEAWANDEAATLDAMGRRAAAGSTKWDDVIIQSIYAHFIAHKDDLGRGNDMRIWAYLAATISEMKSDAHCKVSELKSLTGRFTSFIDTLFAGLEASTEWGSTAAIRLVMYQLWAGEFPGDSNLHAKILTVAGSMDAKSAMKTADQYVDIPYLESLGIYSKLLAGTAERGKTVLALIGVLDGGAPASAKNYLKAMVKPESPELPALPEVPAVEPVLPQPPPRAKIPKVPAVKGRKKVDAIPDKRTAVPAVPDLTALPELAAVKLPPKPKKPVKLKKGETEPAVADAPGRPGRAKRAEAPKVDAVKPYFDPTADFATLVAKRATEDEIIAKLT